MRDAGYIATGYVLTGAVVTGYAVALQVRLRRALHRLQRSLPARGAAEGGAR